MPRSLLWPDPRVKPPFGAAELNLSHPLAAGLRGYYLCQGSGHALGLNLAGPPLSTLAGAPASKAGPGGVDKSPRSATLLLAPAPMHETPQVP